jgi:uncharacterized membrane protein YeaQ/YmgE (transglycosylase-associated protein family)
VPDGAWRPSWNNKQESSMGWIIAVIVGGIAGWLASMVMSRDASMGILWNIVVGCVGSVVGNLIANQFGWAGSVKEFSLTGLIIAFVGAVILLGIANLIQRGRVR